MKGTLFSADFVKDNNDNLRLLEINTDTVVTTSKLGDLNFDELNTIMSTNSITELVLVYKPGLHGELVDTIKSYISANASYITQVTDIQEDLSSIYPSTVEDSSSKFILRMAYDESALFDSEYAKGTLNTLNLFNSYNSSSLTAGYYYSSSVDGIVDNLDRNINPNNIPDVVTKDVVEQHNPLDFHKIGNPNESDTNDDKWNSFINESKSGNKLIQQYHYNSNEVIGGKITSIRSFHIVYGPELNLMTLLGYKVPAIFELPVSLDSEVDNTSYTNKLHDKHYYEYTTNYIKYGANGMLDAHSVLKSDNTYSTFKDLVVGDELTSYFLSGSPQIQTQQDYNDWYSNGSEFPSGSFVTSSVIVLKESKELKYNGLIELVIDTDSVFCGSAKQFIIFESSSNTTKYLSANQLDSTDHYFYDLNGSIIDIDAVNFYVTEESSLNIVELDVEDTDTYIISGSTSFNSIVAHNAPCFVAGTTIHTQDGIKVIEDVVIGDIVSTYNHELNINEFKEVQQVISKTVNETVTYTFENGQTLEATLDHPIYSEEHGYVSFNPSLTAEMYGLKVNQAEVGQTIKTFDNVEDGVISELTLNKESKKVYNLKRVSDNNNFYANSFLAHNRSCFVAGTEIIIKDGDVKNIEDIQEGDVVLSYNTELGISEEQVVIGTKQPLHTDMVTYTFSNGTELTCTFDHPIFVNNHVLASFSPDLTNSRYDLDEEVVKIKEGDDVHLSNGTVTQIESILELPLKETQTFIFTVENNNNFYANNILVHNK